MKRVFVLYIPLGMLLGFIAATLVGPRMISWWFTPPAGVGVSCGPSVEMGLSQFLSFQLGLMITGGLLACGVAWLLRKKKPVASAPPAQPN